MAQFYPNAGAAFVAGLVRDMLDASKMRLYRAEAISPNISTTRAELVAAEATYTGYTAGGATLTEWFAPLLNPLGGFSIDSPKVQFAPISPFTTQNNIGGFWVEDSTGALVVVGTFTNPIPMGQLGNGFPVSASLIFPN